MSFVSMEIIVGTYDEVVIGFHLLKINTDFQIEASFTDHSHAGCIKCVAVSDKGVLASGSTDETVRLLNIKKNRELGSLVHHNGTVTDLVFHKGFLFSTSEDGKMCLWKTFTWECLRTFKGHKSCVNSVSIHPSGKLALTVSKDRTLHTWNLVTGRSAYITNLKQVADIVKWNPSGEKYAIVFQCKVVMYSVETADVCLTIDAEATVNCLQFLNDDVICYGGEGGKVIFHDISQDNQLHVCDTETTRIKGLCLTQLNIEGDSIHRLLVTGSSDGFIKVYKVSEDKDKITTELLVKYNTGFRLTCLAVFSEHSNNVQDREAVNIEDAAKDVVNEEKEKSSDADSDNSGENPRNITDIQKETSTDRSEGNRTGSIGDVNSERSMSGKRNSKNKKKRKKNKLEQNTAEVKKMKKEEGRDVADIVKQQHTSGSLVSRPSSEKAKRKQKKNRKIKK